MVSTISNIAWCAVALTAGALSAEPNDAIVLENPRFRVVLGSNAAWQSLVEKSTGEELAVAAGPVPVAAVVVEGSTRPADRAALAEGRLTLGFAGGDTELVYAVEPTDDWIAFRLAEVTGTRPSRVTLLRLRTPQSEHVGTHLGAAWDAKRAVCLRAMSLATDVRAHRRAGYVELEASAQDAPGPKLEAAAAALIVVPTDELKPVLQRLCEAAGMPSNADDRGVASRDLPIARRSYWFLSFSAAEVDRVIECCRRTGFSQVMMNSGSWCVSPGHYTFNTARYPDGVESLRRTVARLHEAGILVGMHCFASKVSKRDPYVTPVPDRRFWVDRAATLAADVPADAAAIRTKDDLRQWPGSPLASQKVWEGGVTKHQEVVIDDEIIQYESIGPEDRWDTFLGCRRGAWGTKAAAHRAGTQCRHYGVDGCINGYIIDQETTLLDEVTGRLAAIFNACGFDMVYFDGSEDVDRRRFRYYLSNFHAAAMRKFEKRPLIHMGGGLTHQLWHSFTRSATIDQYPGTYLAYLHAGGTLDEFPTCKDHIDRSVRRVLKCHDDMIPGELGWFGIGPRREGYDGLQFDEVEYLMAKSLALDAPISLQTSFARMEAHPLTPDVLAIIRRYEALRLSATVPAATLERLRTPGKDFLLLPAALGERVGDAGAAFAEVERVAAAAGTTDLRAFAGPHQDGTVTAVWHYAGKPGHLVVTASDVTAFDVEGERIALETAGGSARVPLGTRRMTLWFPGRPPDGVWRGLTEARFQPRPPVKLWIRAEEFQKKAGAMARGSEAGIDEPDTLGDVVLCTARPADAKTQGWYCEYRVEIPHAGRWTLWARVRYPTGGDMSFGLVRPGEEITLSGAQVLGNCGRNDGRWHWTGRGGGVTTVPPGPPIRLDLEPGEFVFRIYPREGPGNAAGNPRLDVLCLSDDPDYVPTDADARAALGSEMR